MDEIKDFKEKFHAKYLKTSHGASVAYLFLIQYDIPVSRFSGDLRDITIQIKDQVLTKL